MNTDPEYSENTEKLDMELNKYETLRDTKANNDDDNYWYDPNIIKDISDGVRRKLIGVVVICCMFIVLEAIGAYISDSIAIFTDVAHLFSDLIGFIISLISVNLAKKRASVKHSYGYVRAETVGALFSVVIIWGLTIWILFKSVNKLMLNDFESLDPLYMLGSALLGLFVNIIMAIFLHSHGHGHSHGHSHSHGDSHGHDHGHSHGNSHKHEHVEKLSDEEDTKTNSHEDKYSDTCETNKDKKHHHENKLNGSHHHKHDHEFNLNGHHHHHEHDHEEHHDHHKHKVDNLKTHLVPKKQRKHNLSMVTANESHNIQAAWIHILGDLLQSLGVVIFAIIIYLKPLWKFLDPVISIVFVVIASSFSIPVAKGIIRMMLDSTPRDLDIDRFMITLNSIEHVKEIHDLHVWNLTHGKPAMTAHILVDDRVEYVLKKATIECRKLGIYHTTIQVERVQASHKINCAHNLHR